ncbi:MAG: nucleoside hydrolase [Propionibacteriaceae bacterium]
MTAVNRRRFVAAAGVGAVAAVGGAAVPGSATAATRQPQAFRPPLGPRVRVVSDNDYSGDPDGLYQLVHHLLSPSVDLRAVVGSHLAPGDGFDSSDQTATNAYRRALEVIRLLGRSKRVPAYPGSNVALASRTAPRDSAGARAIIKEALRTDTTLPLFVTMGAGLTELASAFLLEPTIADKLTAIWIGGPEYAELGATPPPDASGIEYNLNIDLLAAQVVFNDSTIPLWQIPRDVYRQALVSMSELAVHVDSRGRVGRYLYDSIDAIHRLAGDAGLNIGETYILGDSPLVLLTALQSSFQADPSSSQYALVKAPTINDDGSYSARTSGSDIRDYPQLDLRLMYGYHFDKLTQHASRH